MKVPPRTPEDRAAIAQRTHHPPNSELNRRAAPSTQAISTSQLPSLTKVLGESHLSSFVLERWAQRHIQKRYAVAPVCPPEDDLTEQE